MSTFTYTVLIYLDTLLNEENKRIDLIRFGDSKKIGACVSRRHFVSNEDAITLERKTNVLV